MNKLSPAILQLRFEFQGDRGRVRRHNPRWQRERRGTACRRIEGFAVVRENDSDGLTVNLTLKQRGTNLFED
jgi:hypothetical protein